MSSLSSSSSSSKGAVTRGTRNEWVLSRCEGSQPCTPLGNWSLEQCGRLSRVSLLGWHASRNKPAAGKARQRIPLAFFVLQPCPECVISTKNPNMPDRVEHPTPSACQTSSCRSTTIRLCHGRSPNFRAAFMPWWPITAHAWPQCQCLHGPCHHFHMHTNTLDSSSVRHHYSSSNVILMVDAWCGPNETPLTLMGSQASHNFQHALTRAPILNTFFRDQCIADYTNALDPSSGFI
jgi:hypothetical protein